MPYTNIFRRPIRRANLVGLIVLFAVGYGLGAGFRNVSGYYPGDGLAGAAGTNCRKCGRLHACGPAKNYVCEHCGRVFPYLSRGPR